MYHEIILVKDPKILGIRVLQYAIQLPEFKRKIELGGNMVIIFDDYTLIQIIPCWSASFAGCDKTALAFNISSETDYGMNFARRIIEYCQSCE